MHHIHSSAHTLSVVLAHRLKPCQILLMCVHRRVWFFADTANHSPVTQTDSDRLLLFAKLSGWRIWFHHGWRNRVCIRFLQFGLLLLLLLPRKNMNFYCLHLRESSPSLYFKSSTMRASTSSWISCIKSWRFQSICACSCSNCCRSCSNSSLRRSSSCLSISGWLTLCLLPFSLASLAQLSLFILFVYIAETSWISLLSSANLLDYVLWHRRNATWVYLNSPMSHSCRLTQNKSPLIAVLQCHCWCTQQCWHHCYRWALLKWSPTETSNRIDSALELITCQTTNLGWSWSSRKRGAMW